MCAAGRYGIYDWAMMCDTCKKYDSAQDSSQNHHFALLRSMPSKIMIMIRGFFLFNGWFLNAHAFGTSARLSRHRAGTECKTATRSSHRASIISMEIDRRTFLGAAAAVLIPVQPVWSSETRDRVTGYSVQRRCAILLHIGPNVLLSTVFCQTWKV